MRFSSRAAAALLLASAALLAGCPGGPAKAKFSLDEDAGFFDAPFPIFARAREDGTVRWSDFPNPNANALVAAWAKVADEEPRGFSTNGAVFFPFTDAIDPATLPDSPEASLGSASSAFLVDVDPDSPERGRLVPILADFKARGNAYRADHLLALLPLQGFVLRPETLYAAVLTRDLRDALGRPLPVVPEVARALAGVAPDGPRGAEMRALYALLRETLADLGRAPAEVLAATVFRTMDPVREQAALGEWVRARPLPLARDVRFQREHGEFCVLEGKVDFPIFQDGERPYYVEGGRIRFDEDGEPILQWTEEVLFALAVPKGTMPAAGWPLAMFGNGTGGWRFSVMDRGATGFNPGEGPAKFLGARGIGAIATDPILHWTRDPAGDPTGGWFFNPLNPHAIRDNLRQAAAEFAVLAGLAETLSLDPALCPESDASAGPGGRIVYDPGNLFYMSQSQGSTHGPSAVATEPRIRAAVFSGAGGSAIYTMRYKTDFPVRDLISLAIGILPERVEIFDPALTLVQTVMDPAEALNFARPTIREPILGGPPRHVLVLEGKGDSYVPNPMDGALAAALGLDLVRPIVLPEHLEEIGLAGRSVLDAPVSLNNAEGPAPVTAALAQYEPEPGKDGHFVTFQLNAPKHRYSCFLGTLAAGGAPTVAPASQDPLAPCE